MAWRFVSTSATADDMLGSSLVKGPHYSVSHLFVLEWRRSLNTMHDSDQGAVEKRCAEDGQAYDLSVCPILMRLTNA